MLLLFQSMREWLASKQRLARRLCPKHCGSALGILAALWPRFGPNSAGSSLANEAGSNNEATEADNMGAKQESLQQ